MYIGKIYERHVVCDRCNLQAQIKILDYETYYSILIYCGCGTFNPTIIKDENMNNRTNSALGIVKEGNVSDILRWFEKNER